VSAGRQHAYDPDHHSNYDPMTGPLSPSRQLIPICSGPFSEMRAPNVQWRRARNEIRESGVQLVVCSGGFVSEFVKTNMARSATAKVAASTYTLALARYLIVLSLKSL